MRVRVRDKLVGIAAVSMRTTLKYRRNWNKNGPAVKLLQKFMPTDGTKKGYRLFIDIGDKHKMRYTVPPAVRVALKRAGYVVTDYLAKKCVKIADKEQKNVFNIGKVIAKDEHAKNAFDNDPQLQNSKSNKVQIVISCHPYDIIGMSTGRDWDNQSCMRLKDGRIGVTDGAYNKHVSHDVAEGTLVAYAIRADDTNINTPLCRCLVKPFISEDESILYRREGSVYGNKVPGFDSVLNTFIRKLNEEVPVGMYKLISTLYDDGDGRSVNYLGADNDDHGVEIERGDLSGQPDLLIPYLKQVMQSDRKDHEKATVILKAMELHGAKLDNEELDFVADLIKPLDGMGLAIRDTALMYSLPFQVVHLAQRNGYLQQPKSALEAMGVRDHLNLSAIGGDGLRSLIERLEKEFNNNDVTALAKGFMTGGTALPTRDMFDNSPKVLSYIYTIASAARFYTLWGETEYERQVHDLLDILGTDIPKVLDDDFFYSIRTMGKVDNAMSLCVMLDNADTVDLDTLMIVRETEAVDCLAERRPFRAFERQTNSAFTHYMDRVKYAMLRRCVMKPYDQDKLKPNKAAVIAYAMANPDEVEAIEWTDTRAIALLAYHVPLFVYITNNVPVQTYKIVNALLSELSTYEGPPLDPEDNIYVEVMLRLAVFAGNNMEPPVRLNTKVKLDNLDNESFPAWFAENKELSSNALVDNLRWITYGTVGGTIPRRTVILSNMLPLIVEHSNEANGVNAWGSFSMDDVAQNHRAIIKSIQRLPDLTNALEALEQFVDNVELEETEDEHEGARALIEGGEMGVQLDEEDVDAHAEQLEEALDIVNSRNMKILAQNEKLYRMIGDLNRNLGNEEDDDEERVSILHYFFDKFSEQAIDAHESELDDIGEVVRNKLSDLEHYYEEYRDTAGVS